MAFRSNEGTSASSLIRSPLSSAFNSAGGLNSPIGYRRSVSMFLIGIQLSLNSEREIVKRSVPGAVATGLPLRYDGCEDCDPVATAPGTDLVSHIETF